MITSFHIGNDSISRVTVVFPTNDAKESAISWKFLAYVDQISSFRLVLSFRNEYRPIMYVIGSILMLYSHNIVFSTGLEIAWIYQTQLSPTEN